MKKWFVNAKSNGPCFPSDLTVCCVCVNSHFVIHGAVKILSVHGMIPWHAELFVYMVTMIIYMATI